MRQIALSDAGFDRFRKKTRKERFLDDMEKIIPWAELAEAIELFYPKPQGSGRWPTGCCWSTFPALVQPLGSGRRGGAYDSLAMRRFMGIKPGREPAPD